MDDALLRRQHWKARHEDKGVDTRISYRMFVSFVIQCYARYSLILKQPSHDLFNVEISTRPGLYFRSLRHLVFEILKAQGIEDSETSYKWLAVIWRIK
jgi:hypothetical protein